MEARLHKVLERVIAKGVEGVRGGCGLFWCHEGQPLCAEVEKRAVDQLVLILVKLELRSAVRYVNNFSQLEILIDVTHQRQVVSGRDMHSQLDQTSRDNVRDELRV